MTIATEMFYSEMTPDGKPLYVAKTPEQKRSQRQFFFWYIPENRPQIRATLERLKLGKIGRLLLSRSAKAEGKEFFPSKEREENEDYRQREQQKREQRAVTIVPQKSGEKGRWENSARKERRAAQFGNSGNREGRRDFNRDNPHDFRDDNRNSNFGNGEQRKSFHSDRKFGGDRRDTSGNKGRDFRESDRRDFHRDNKQNSRNNQRGNEKRNNSPVQFSSMRRGK